MSETISKILLDYGLVGAVGLLAAGLLAYVWRDWSRIATLEARVQTLEDEMRKQVLPVLMATQEALRDSTEQVTLSRKVIESFLLKNS